MALRDKAPESDFRGYFSDTEIKLGRVLINRQVVSASGQTGH
jgi:hypothetical protein